MPDRSSQDSFPRIIRRLLSGGIRIAGVLALTVTSGQAQQMPLFVNTLLPQPAKISLSTGSMELTSSFTVSSNAVGNPILQEGVGRMLSSLEGRTNTSLSKTVRNGATGATLSIFVVDSTSQRPTLGSDESYTLDITEKGITLHANTIFGALYGLETLQQTLQVSKGSFVFPALHVADSPRFAWRGLTLDVVRHFMPLPVLYRTIDGLAAVKMNVLHLHLTDDQGFRIESKRFPRLTQYGSDGMFYTQEQMRELIKYAGARGVRIVPEFDVPAHVTSWLVGMPELASMPRKYEVGRTFGIWDAALDPTRESTYKLLDSFIEEMASIFPDEYMHMGGDESQGKDWKANPAIVAYMRAHNIESTNDLQAQFSARVLTLVQKHHKQMVGWDEILQPTTPKEAIIQSWRGVSSLVTAAKQGNRSILSAPYYLDGMKTAERMYLDDPLPQDSGLTAEESKLILGGEAAMWAEQITPQTVDSRIWPRTAALAERFWSPQGTRDVDDLYRRLAVESIRLEALGLTHISGPDAGLRRLTGSEAGAAQLAVLTSVLTPVSFGERYQGQKTSQLTPMNNVVDFTRPDPPARHEFLVLVDRYLNSKDSAERELARGHLESIFRAWIDTHPLIDSLAVGHPLLNEIQLRREQLPQLGLLGLEAIGYIESGKIPDAKWKQTQDTLLKVSAEHHEMVDFVVLPPLQSLIDATQSSRER